MADWCDDCAWPEACAQARECARREAGEIRSEALAEDCSRLSAAGAAAAAPAPSLVGAQPAGEAQFRRRPFAGSFGLGVFIVETPT
ncbi:hypothetical protein [Hyphomonas sp.]|uniref:hypothetical protein n=1 Tax=Hyphomonas sp. TaxID=87 RepID=UPI00391C7729